MRSIVLLGLALLLQACSVVHTYAYPRELRDRYLVAMGETDCRYESLGYAQFSRGGVYLFGFVPVVDADLETIFGTVLPEQLEASGADGIINLRFHERQYTTAARILMALPPFFLFPLPTYVELSGELVRFPEGEKGRCLGP